MDADKETVELQKSLALNSSESARFRENMIDVANNTNNINITASKLLEAFGELNKHWGFITNFSEQTLNRATLLKNVIGISADSSNELAGSYALSNKGAEKAYSSSLKTSYELQRQYGIQIDLRQVLEESGKVTGQLRANLLS